MSASTAAPSPRTATWQGIGLVALGAFCFSTSIIFIRLISGMDALAITFYRSLFAFLFFCLTLLRFREPLNFSHYRAHLPILIGLGAAMGLTAALYTYAIQHTTAANAALLVNSAPLYVALLAPWLLKEARPPLTWPSLALAGVGIVLITGFSGEGGLRLDSLAFGGILAGIVSGFTYAMPILIGRHLRGKVSGITQIVWGSGVAAVLLSPFALRADLGVALANLPLLIPLGIITMGLSYLLFFLGLQRISAQMTSITGLFEPVSGLLIGLLIFQEGLTPLGALGSLLVLAAITLISRPAR